MFVFMAGVPKKDKFCKQSASSAFNTRISIKHGNNKKDPDTLLLEMDRAKELKLKSPLGIDGLIRVHLEQNRTMHKDY